MASIIPNLRHLRAFEAAARLASVNAAAREVHLSQPAVTQAIAKLEAAFASPLFVRRSTGVFPTAAGRILEARARRLFRQVDEAIADAAGLGGRRDAARLAALQHRLSASNIRALLAVAEHGSFSQGARREGLSEASLHRAARDFERLVGRPLFLRGPAGIGASKLARELARRLKVALRELEQASEEIRAAAGTATGRIAVASLPMARTLILPRTVNALLAMHPEAFVEIHEGPYELLLDSLRGGTVDFLIGALREPPPAPDVVEEMLLDDPFAVVVRRDHPLFAEEGLLTAERLARFDWVLPRQGTPIRRAFEHLFAGQAVWPRANVETSSLVATRAILAESDRITLLSRRQIAIEEEMGLLAVLPFPLPDTDRPIGVTTRADWLPGPVQAAFWTLLRAHCRA